MPARPTEARLRPATDSSFALAIAARDPSRARAIGALGGRVSAGALFSAAPVVFCSTLDSVLPCRPTVGRPVSFGEGDLANAGGATQSTRAEDDGCWGDSSIKLFGPPTNRTPALPHRA